MSLNLGPRERVAVLTLILLILGGGFFPQMGILSRFHAAEQLLSQREKTTGPTGEGPGGTEAIQLHQHKDQTGLNSILPGGNGANPPQE